MQLALVIMVWMWVFVLSFLICEISNVKGNFRSIGNASILSEASIAGLSEEAI